MKNEKKYIFFVFLHTIFGNLKDLPYLYSDRKIMSI